MAVKTSTNGFILAGGQSRRMGRDKAMLEWGNVSLLEHMTQLLLTVTDSVQIVGRGEFPDRIPGKGPLGGILTALEITDQDNNIFLGVDLPLLTGNFLTVLRDRSLSTSKTVTACRIDGRFPLCVGIRRTLANAVAERIEVGDLAVHRFITESDPEVLEQAELLRLGVDPEIFANINTSDDLTKFR
jgi:molybdenum cofactor guanylyltransferase